MTLSRRALLRSGVVALGAEPSGVLCPLRRWVQDGGPRRVGEAHAKPPPAGLSASELDDLIAFAELLVEGRTLSPVERAPFLENIAEHVAREPDDLELYRTTVTLLRRLAGRRFASLDLSGRLALMARYRLNSPDMSLEDHRGPFASDTRLVRTRVRRNLIADYYNSPAGWAVVGYDVFPGRCGDLLRYTRPET